MLDESEDESTSRIPEWVVTFGDMMSLLLTFFIMLVSLSEVKEEEKYQALVDSMRRQFGYDDTIESLADGQSRPRPSEMRTLSTVGRAKRKDMKSGGVEAKAPVGEQPLVRIIRPGRLTVVGSVVFFDAGSAQLADQGRQVLDKIASELKGKPQKIEIRGHTSAKVVAKAIDVTEAMSLAHARSAVVYRYLVQHHGIDPKRFRLSAAAAAEPIHLSATPAHQARNPRVEVFLLDETVDDLRGSDHQRDDRYLPEEEIEELSDV